MKYEVQVGREFPCYVAEDNTPPPPVIVNITQNAAALAPPSNEEKRKPSLKTKLAALLLLLGLGPATVYGFATGDFSTLKAIAFSSRDLMEFGTKLLK